MSSNGTCNERPGGSGGEPAAGAAGEPLVLALDASHERGSVAVCRGADVLAEILFDASDTHSATLMPAVDACLSSAKASLGAVGLLAVVSGPGSFTGLRIALATVKGFAAARGTGVVPVSSLEVLAAAMPCASRLVLPLIDARRGEVYGALYDTGAFTPRQIVPLFAARPGALGEILGAAGVAEPLVLCGTGALRYRGEIEPSLPADSVFAPQRWAIPSASLCAILARGRRPLAGGEIASLEPLYLRPPDARLPAGAPLAEGGGDGA
jgi:tRNA threonylcarbamoyladenosine biosynthesis protein TsaB